MADNQYFLTIFKHKLEVGYGRYRWAITNGKPDVRSIEKSGRPLLRNDTACGDTIFKWRARMKMRGTYKRLILNPGGKVVWQKETVG